MEEEVIDYFGEHEDRNLEDTLTLRAIEDLGAKDYSEHK